MTSRPDRVVVVGPNPAMDLILEVAALDPGESHRAQQAMHLAGGKPVNVARTLRRLGIDVSLVSPLGGHLGPAQLIREACTALGIDLQATEIGEETRTCVVIADAATGEATVVNERGPHLSGDEADAYRSSVEKTLRPGGIVVMSGSLPPGLPADFYAHVVEHAHAVGARTIVDTSGEPLRLALEAGPRAVKVNGDELLAVTGATSVDEAALQLGKAIPHVAVTLGSAGSLYVGPDGVSRLPALPVTVTNPTGAGDAFLAGLVAGLVRGHPWLAALAEATSAAALVCGRLGPDIGTTAGPAGSGTETAIETSVNG
ncbi:MAG TPA: 1-phosphofructokinase family hexose kinase [Chloroflexota bacterium]|nr:1-phosphofructokinase family hexose kinase [Chloroflexota bacterium]